MSYLTVILQNESWSQAILNPVLVDVLSFHIAIIHLSEKNADFLKGIL